jgi:aspartyl-tRNA(Asn)/glutamyl-tRNA(Gln) amidotransferase subunit B
VSALVPTIGLEVHCQLNTRTKMFCGCPIAHGAPPNTAVCPVCLGHPGALPVVNDEAVRLSVRAGMALGCIVQDRSVFARKHYFYPDSPKGYQISQFDRPICVGGSLEVSIDGSRQRFALERIHMEEDAGKLSHEGERSAVDWNRGGTPLIEVVGRPDIHSPEEAEAWMRMLHRVMVRAGVTLGDMEKGHFRCDANVSLGEPGGELGTRVELKNINSFRFVARALRHEIARQRSVLSSGGRVVQSTRSWTGNDTVPLRSKENDADYRYFPDPDLGVVAVKSADRNDAAERLDGVPLDRWLLDSDVEAQQSFQQRYGLKAEDIQTLMRSPPQRALFEAAVESGGAASDMVKWVLGPISQWINEHGSQGLRLSPVELVSLVGMVSTRTITRDVARVLLAELCGQGGSAAQRVADRGLARVDDSAAIQAAVDAVLTAHPDEVARFHQGQHRLMGFFIGAIMRQFSGRADPEEVRAVLQSRLTEGSRSD